MARQFEAPSVSTRMLQRCSATAPTLARHCRIGYRSDAPRGAGFHKIDVAHRVRLPYSMPARRCRLMLCRALPLVALTDEKFEKGSLGFCYSRSVRCRARRPKIAIRTIRRRCNQIEKRVQPANYEYSPGYSNPCLNVPRGGSVTVDSSPRRSLLVAERNRDHFQRSGKCPC
jgi:hypothetical protein